jgi:hypothetical protein
MPSQGNSNSRYVHCQSVMGDIDRPKEDRNSEFSVSKN